MLERSLARRTHQHPVSARRIEGPSPSPSPPPSRSTRLFSYPHPDPRYVQDRIEERAVEVCECLFSKGGRVYVCGDGQAMASDVHAALVLVCTQQLNVSPAEAEERLRTLAEEGRYCREIWN